MWPVFLHGCRRPHPSTAAGRTSRDGRSYRPRLDVLEYRLPLGDTLGGLLAWWHGTDLFLSRQALALTASPEAVITASHRPGDPVGRAHHSAPAVLGWPCFPVTATESERCIPRPGADNPPNRRAEVVPETRVVPSVNPFGTGSGRPQPLSRSATAAPPALDCPTLAALAQLSPIVPFNGTDSASPVRKVFASSGLMALAGLALNESGSFPQHISRHRASPATPNPEQIRQAQARSNLSFEANLGQTDPRVQFLTRGSGYTLYLTRGEAILHLQPPTTPKAASAAPETATIVRMQLLGGNPAPMVQGREELPGKVNYFLSNDPSKWRSNVPTFGRVEYDEVYPGIDQVWYGNQQQLEFDFLVTPGADPGAIQLAFAGVSDLEIDAGGDLVLHTAVGALRQHRPFVYQEVAGVRHEVVSNYVLTGPKQVGFQLGAHDAAQPLVIDPVVAYSGYVGGAGYDQGLAIALDTTRAEFGGPFAYVTGSTQSLLTTPGVVQPDYAGGDSDAFVQKFNATSGSLEWSTYLGGSNLDIGTDIAVEPDGWYVYVSGVTNSFFPPEVPGSFPTWNCVSLQCDWAGGESDAFAVMLDWNGSNTFPGPAGPPSISYSTILGGAGMDLGTGIDTEYSVGTGIPAPQGRRPQVPPDPFVAGTTDSPDLIPPTAPPGFQPVYGGGLSDAFVVRIGPSFPNPPTWIYFSFLGGSLEDYGADIATDDLDHAHVTGTTATSETAKIPFPIAPPKAAFQPAYGGGEYDSFVTKVEPLGTYLVYSSYLGGSGFDEGLAIDVAWAPVGGIAHAHVTGRTDSALDFPGTTPESYGGGPHDAFVTKVEYDGTGLLYSTFLGGNAEDVGFGISVTPSEDVFVTGMTTSTAGWVLVSPLSCCTALNGDTDAFVTKYGPTGTLDFSTYLGGAGTDIGRNLAADSAFNIAVIGITNSDPFPGVMGPYGGEPFDGFVSLITP